MQNQNTSQVLGALIKLIRNEKNITQMDLANSSDVNISNLNRIESGKREGNPSEFTRIFKVLDIDYVIDESINNKLRKELSDIKKSILNFEYDFIDKKSFKHRNAYIYSPNIINYYLVEFMSNVIDINVSEEELNKSISALQSIVNILDSNELAIYKLFYGIHLINNYKYNEAINEIKASIDIIEFPISNLYLGKARALNNDILLAYNDLSRAKYMFYNNSNLVGNNFCNLYIGLIYAKMHKYNEAIDIYVKVMDYAKISENVKLYNETAINLIYAYIMNNNVEKALSFVLNINDDQDIDIVLRYLIIAFAYYKLNDYSKSKKYLNKLEKLKKSPVDELLVEILKLLTSNGNLAVVIKLMKKAIMLCEKKNDYVMLEVVLTSAIRILSELRRYKEVSIMQDKLLKIYIKKG